MLLLALALALAAPAAAEQRLASIGERGTLLLEDGREVGLAGLILPHDGDGDGAAALARRAQEELARLLDGRALHLVPATDGHDRWGRVLAQVERADGIWVQGALLDAGLARVALAPGRQERAAEMLAREAAARAAGRGLWALEAYQPRPAATLRRGGGGFLVVEGRVHRLGEGRQYLYLDLGPDWRRDMSLRLPRGQRRAFSAGSAVPIEDLVGRRIRARGWVLTAFGPVIELDHPEQIELLDDPTGESAGGIAGGSE
jgi:micrococcal nuclease